MTTSEARPHRIYGLAIDSSSTDAQGYFEIQNLPPGRYIVGVNLQDRPNQYNPYARTVYPGGASEPEVLTLLLGQSIDLGT